MFNNIAFSWPATLDDIASASNSALGDAGAQLSDAGSRLSAVPAMSVVVNPVATAAAGSAENLADVMQAVLTEIKMVCVHPWSQGIGQGETQYRYLSPANAVAAAANKLIDIPDAHRPTTAIDAIAIVITAKSFDVFSKTLKQFNDILPVADLQLCQRRAGQLATLDKDKQVMPDAAMNARWRGKGIGGIGHCRIASTQAGELCSHAVGYEAGDDSAADELQQLITKKNAALEAAASAVDELASVFAGGVGKGVFFNNQTPAQIKNSLSNSSLSHDDPIACCLLLAGAGGSLNIVKEMLGL